MCGEVKKSFVLLIYFTLAVSTLLVFWQVRDFDFVNYDDNKYVSENPNVLNGLSSDDLYWAFTTDQASNWHPLTWFSLALDRQLFGPNPAGFHLTNLFFHIANTLLLFFVLKQMTNAIWQSAFVAALFAIHPMHVESVAWISERKDVLSTFFWMLAMLAYVRYVKKPGDARYLLVLFIFALGLMAKPMLVTFPFILLLLDYWPLNRLMPQTAAVAGCQKHKSVPVANNPPTLYRIVIEKIPFFTLAVFSSGITFFVQQNTGAMADIETLSLNNRIVNAFLSYAEYIGKMFWPSNLAVFYPLNAEGIPFWQTAACALLLLGISVFVVYLGRSQRYLPIGWFWFVAALIPVIGIVQVGLQAYADRYTYISYIGLFIMLAWGLPAFLSKWISASPVESTKRKIVLGSSMVILLTTLGICAHQQASYWKNSITLFSHAIEVTQNNYVAYDNLGNDYARLGRFTEATGAYMQAIKSKPDYIEAYFGLEFIYDKLGYYKEAVEVCKQAIRFNPDHDEVSNNLSVVYSSSRGLCQKAASCFRKQTKINPNFARAYLNLGVAYDGLGRFIEAIDAYKQAVKIKPDLAEAYYNLGLAHVKLGHGREAINAYKQAVKIKPDLAEAHANLGYAYLTIGDKNSAMAEYNILKSLNSEMANNLLNQINK
jgi:tetratricopeptide (TPR) repeat protein